MERRDFLAKLTAGAIGALAFTRIVEAGTIVPAGPLFGWKPSLSDIMHVAWPAVVAELHRHPGNAYYDLLAAGKAEVRPFEESDPRIEAMTIPMCWTQKDEDMQLTEANKIAFCKTMLENLCWSFDEYLAEEAAACTKLILGKAGLYELSPTYKMYAEDSGGFYVSAAHVQLARVR